MFPNAVTSALNIKNLNVNFQKAPYVCNICSKIKRCNKNKAFYIAQNADKSSQDLLVSCRQGINQDPADIAILNDLISPLLSQGQSLAHIYAFHGHEIPCSRKTLYNYIEQGVFTARNIDLMLMCHKVTHKNLIDSSPLFRDMKRNLMEEFVIT